jgi:predicted DsbA family dithiol-disulfide isomerase
VLLPNPNDEYRQMMWVKSIYPMAGKLGVKMRMPSITTRTRVAHEAAAWARAQGKDDIMNEALFRAYFERSADIGNVDVVVALAKEAALDSDALRASLTRHEHLHEVLADEEQAQRYDLSGVPAFICNGKGLIGVQNEEALRKLVVG